MLSGYMAPCSALDDGVHRPLMNAVFGGKLGRCHAALCMAITYLLHLCFSELRVTVTRSSRRFLRVTTKRMIVAAQYAVAVNMCAVSFPAQHPFWMTARPVCIALRRASATLLSHIANVICTITKEQMIWPHARAVIATMQYAHTFRYWAKRQLPRHTMRGLYLILAKVEAPVTALVMVRRPVPTLARTVNLVPKTLRERPNFSHLRLHPYGAILSQIGG